MLFLLAPYANLETTEGPPTPVRWHGLKNAAVYLAKTFAHLLAAPCLLP